MGCHMKSSSSRVTSVGSLKLMKKIFTLKDFGFLVGRLESISMSKESKSQADKKQKSTSNRIGHSFSTHPLRTCLSVFFWALSLSGSLWWGSLDHQVIWFVSCHLKKVSKIEKKIKRRERDGTFRRSEMWFGNRGCDFLEAVLLAGMKW